MQNDVPVVDDHEGTNGEGNVGVKSEGQVVYERKFQRIQKKNTMEVMRDRLIWQVCCYFRSNMEEDTANKYLLLGAGPDWLPGVEDFPFAVIANVVLSREGF